MEYPFDIIPTFELGRNSPVWTDFSSLKGPFDALTSTIASFNEQIQGELNRFQKALEAARPAMEQWRRQFEFDLDQIRKATAPGTLWGDVSRIQQPGEPGYQEALERMGA
jgi:hypothetical protein